MNSDDLMTTQDLAQLVKSPIETVRYWDFKGTGPKSFKVGRRRLYLRSDVMAWLEAKYQEGAK